MKNSENWPVGGGGSALYLQAGVSITGSSEGSAVSVDVTLAVGSGVSSFRRFDGPYASVSSSSSDLRFLELRGFDDIAPSVLASNPVSGDGAVLRLKTGPKKPFVSAYRLIHEFASKNL